MREGPEVVPIPSAEGSSSEVGVWTSTRDSVGELTALRARSAVAAAQTCVRNGPVTLASGGTSEVYIDLRPQLLHPNSPVTRIVMERLRHMDDSPVYGKTIVAGVAFGGIPLAMAAVHRLWCDAVVVRKQSKGHGNHSLVIGDQRLRDKPIILLEDVVTTGGSVLWAVQALRDEGWDPVSVLAAVDRGGGRAVADVLPFSAALRMDEAGVVTPY